MKGQGNNTPSHSIDDCDEDASCLIRQLIDWSTAAADQVATSVEAKPSSLLLYNLLTESDNAACHTVSEAIKAIATSMRTLVQETSGTELHATSVQTFFLIQESDDELLRKFEELKLFCVIIACIALHKAPINEQDGAIIRPKRWQSICFETMRLFQTIVRQSLLQGLSLGQQQVSHDALTCYDLSDWICLWTNIVLPTTWRLQEKLRLNNPPSMSMAFQAGVAATCSLLARGAAQCARDAPSGTAALDALLTGLDGVFDDATVLWVMEARRLERGFCRSQNKEFGCTLELSDWLHLELAEDVVGMQTHMDNLGKAMLAARAFTRLKSTGIDTKADPRETVIAYLDFWLGQVNILVGFDADDFVDACDQHGVISSTRNMDRHDLIDRLLHKLGLQLLELVLDMIPPESRELSWVGDGKIQSALMSPCPSLTTLQILANRIAYQAMRQRQSKSEMNNTVGLARESFQLMLRVLQVYQAKSQVELIRRLLIQCPYNELKPKLLDLLRHAIYWKDDNSEAMLRLSELIDRDIMQPFEASLAEAGNESSQIQDQSLIDSIELYETALNLVYQQIRIRQSFLGAPDLQARLIKVEKTSKALCDRWSHGRSAPDRWFRLLLLRDSTSKLLQQFMSE